MFRCLYISQGEGRGLGQIDILMYYIKYYKIYNKINNLIYKHNVNYNINT
jgi:hypothetical protein